MHSWNLRFWFQLICYSYFVTLNLALAFSKRAFSLYWVFSWTPGTSWGPLAPLGEHTPSAVSLWEALVTGIFISLVLAGSGYLHGLRKAALRGLTKIGGIDITVFMMGAEP